MILHPGTPVPSPRKRGSYLPRNPSSPFPELRFLPTPECRSYPSGTEVHPTPELQFLGGRNPGSAITPTQPSDNLHLTPSSSRREEKPLGAGGRSPERVRGPAGGRRSTRGTKASLHSAEVEALLLSRGHADGAASREHASELVGAARPSPGSGRPPPRSEDGGDVVNLGRRLRCRGSVSPPGRGRCWTRTSRPSTRPSSRRGPDEEGNRPGPTPYDGSRRGGHFIITTPRQHQRGAKR